jgi:hypothetical protein
LDSTIKSSVSFLEDKIEAVPDNASDDPSSSLDYHDLMVTLLVSCELDSDILLDPQCILVKQYHALSQTDRDAFWHTVGDGTRDGLTCNFVLQSTEYTPPSVIGKIYKLFCGMSKYEQRVLL